MNKSATGVLAFLLIVFSLALPSAFASENQWLAGVWELSYDPDGDTKDWLEFTFDGKAFSVDSKHTRQVPGSYEISGSSITVTFHWKGKSIPISLTFETDRDALYAFSKRTGSTSIYKKVK